MTRSTSRSRNDAPPLRGGVVIGGSAGGMVALLDILDVIPKRFELPMVVGFHLHKSDEGRFAEHLASRYPFPVVEANDKQPIEPGTLYTAPADYHLLIERDDRFSLSIDPRVNYARPAIDVLFTSAARAWRDATTGAILSGANHDGADGMAAIAALGGTCIAQDPRTAENPTMPRAAIDAAQIETVLPPVEIGAALSRIIARGRGAPEEDELPDAVESAPRGTSPRRPR